jgi:hypothetical protein
MTHEGLDHIALVTHHADAGHLHGSAPSTPLSSRVIEAKIKRLPAGSIAIASLAQKTTGGATSSAGRVTWAAP